MTLYNSNQILNTKKEIPSKRNPENTEIGILEDPVREREPNQIRVHIPATVPVTDLILNSLKEIKIKNQADYLLYKKRRNKIRFQGKNPLKILF
ncbi:hypothetical protein LEP1GSC133_3085 [Leptospira borgpetersenii serovar Pomona str. 200901868]|uniref:Uncharacterized protein n=1 Tax=Leptospira borgpetersenii serovar Pomona str. 200901868 TaxID=1192866 RepID=M6W6D0_LEPBO|nr:hypothetical protein LEP1GSC133_3085 [Leptospira borgpetersenii serovar Pomona str. 200901868]